MFKYFRALTNMTLASELNTSFVLAPDEAQEAQVDRNRRFAGFVESFTPEGFMGWAINLNTPSEQILVSVDLEGVPVALGMTGLVRQDVRSTFNDLSLKRRKVQPGFDFPINREAMANALARIDPEGLPKEGAALTVAVLSFDTRYVLPLEDARKSLEDWAAFFGITEHEIESAPKDNPIFQPEYAGRFCACLDDMSVLVPEEVLDFVLHSPFFHPHHYIEQADAAGLCLAHTLQNTDDIHLAAHFCIFGLPQGISPAPGLDFDPRFYEGANPVDPGMAPLMDFMRAWAGDDPRLPNAAVAGQLPIYQNVAAEMGLPTDAKTALRLWSVAGGFATAERVGISGDVVEAMERALTVEDIAQFDISAIVRREQPPLSEADITNATAVIRALNAFDTDYYYANNTDVRGVDIDPLDHYVRFGEREGRSPHPDFDPNYYLLCNADVRRVVPCAYPHYLEFGRHEGRLGRLEKAFDDRPSFGKPILFVGHSALLAGAERVLLELVKWTRMHTRREITVYLMEGGPMTADFCRYATVVTAPADPILNQAMRLKLARMEWEYVYLNTVVAGGFLKGIDHATLGRLNVVGHIHEMEKVLEEHRAALDLLLPNAKHLISASPASTATLVTTYGQPEDRVTTVPAFITPVHESMEAAPELRERARAELGIDPAARVVMGCGSLYWRKGPDIFVEVAALLNQDPDAPVHFVWVGAGPDHQDLLQQCENLGVADKVTFTGLRNDASAMLAAADLFFLSSREDPFPLVCMEAAQHRVPTIFIEGTTGIGRFVMPDHEASAGWSAPDLAPDTIARVIASALADDADRLARGARAQERLYLEYTSAANCNRIYHTVRDALDIDPLVSVIVPNYNHADYLGERLSSILDQTMQDFELIVLDDCSTDASHEVINAAIANRINARFDPNETNSGAVFRQWQKGLNQAKAPYIWVAESDDRCDLDFLHLLLDGMADPSVVIATGNTVPFSIHGADPEPMKRYLNSQCPGLFDAPFKLDGDVFVNYGMGSACLLVNASGLLMHTDTLRAHVAKGLDYSMAGDWVIYLYMLTQGKCVYEPRANNHFRRHPTSRVHEVEGTETYFEERKRIADLVYDLFAVSPALHGRIRSTLQHEVDRFQHKSPGITLADVAPNREPTLRMRRRVAFYVHGMTFSKGGIERLAAQLANYLASVGFEVHILARHWGTHDSIYPLHDHVKLVQVFSEDWMEASIDAVHRYLVMNGIEVFVPMLSEWLFAPLVEAGRRAGVPVIASEHNDPWKIEELWWSAKDRAEVFAKADRIHLLSEVFIRSLPEELRDRAAVIPNGVDVERYTPGAPDRAKRIVSAGRLVPQKRMDLAIAGFAKSGLAEDGWELDIYGAGDDRPMLASLITALGMDGHVHLRGTSNEMHRIMAEAAICVMASDFEGFGIVVVEAMACGTPVVAFADCNGPNEIIQDGRNGRLVPIDPGQDRAEALGAMLRDMACDETALRALGQAAVERAKDFSLSKFLESWEKLLSEA